TAYSAIVSDQLGIPLENIRFVQSDTALVARGGGTGGSRSLQLGGSSVLETAQLVAERARDLAAELLEAAPDDIVIGMDGRIGVTGVPARALTWSELAVAAKDKGEPLLVQHDFSSSGSTFPFGAHIAVV